MIFEVGRVCMKIAGRDANKHCVVIKKIDSNFVEIDGQTRRRKVNITHLEPLDIKVDVKENADNKVVAKALTDAGFETAEKVVREKKTPKPQVTKSASKTTKVKA